VLDTVGLAGGQGAGAGKPAVRHVRVVVHEVVQAAQEDGADRGPDKTVLAERVEAVQQRLGGQVSLMENRPAEDWWSPFTLGVGPAGVYYGSLDATQREAVRAEGRQLLGRPVGRFTLEAACWFAAGTAPAGPGVPTPDRHHRIQQLSSRSQDIDREERRAQ